MFHLLGLHFEPRFIGVEGNHQIPRSTQLRLVSRHDGRRYRRRLDQVFGTDFFGPQGRIQSGWRRVEEEGFEQDWKLVGSE